MKYHTHTPAHAAPKSNPAKLATGSGSRPNAAPRTKLHSSAPADSVKIRGAVKGALK